MQAADWVWSERNRWRKKQKTGGRAGYGVNLRKKKRTGKPSRVQRKQKTEVHLWHHHLAFVCGVLIKYSERASAQTLPAFTSIISCLCHLQILTLMLAAKPHSCSICTLVLKTSNAVVSKPWGCSCKLANLLFIFGRPGARRCALLPSPPPVQSLYLLIAFCRVYLGSFL